MVLYKILDSKNLSYNPGLINRLCLLYKGGYDVVNNSDLFLTQLASETPASFEDRKRCVSYLPFMSDIIDNYASMLFADEISITEAADADNPNTIGSQENNSSIYKLFLSAADMKGNSLEEVMRAVTTDALIHKEAFIGLDFPKVDEVPINLLEEEVTRAARPYVYYIEPTCIIDWSCDVNGKFKWLKIKSDNIIQDDPLKPPMHQIEFKIWRLENGVATWQTFKTKELALNKFPSPNDDINLFSEGKTTFREIPILKFCLPDGLALGNKIGPICEDIFQRSSILVNGENKSLNAMRVVFLGDETSAPGGPMTSQVQENPFRHLSLTNDWESKGVAVLGSNDRMEVIESEGHAFTIVADQIDKLIEKLKEVVHQMANSASAHSKNVGRSAASKQEDRHSTEILLTAYGNLVKDFIKNVMICVSTARSESIVWTIDGLDNFSVIDRDQLIVEAKSFPAVTADSKSPTFTKLYTEKFYLSLLNGTSHEDALQIRQEIMEAIDNALQETDTADVVDQTAAAPQAKTNDNDSNGLTVSKSGNLAAPDGAHLQSGQHIDPQSVYDQLSEDYKEQDIQWVLHVPWMGPMEVPLSSIDFSNKDNWKASEDDDKVANFADKISNEGFSKPIILVNSPANNNKMVIVDGHHRALAYMKSGQAAMAYVGQVGKMNGPWDKLHSKQVGDKQASLTSNQK